VSGEGRHVTDYRYLRTDASPSLLVWQIERGLASMNDILDLNRWLNLLTVERRFRQQTGYEPGLDVDLVARALDEIGAERLRHDPFKAHGKRFDADNTLRSKLPWGSTLFMARWSVCMGFLECNGQGSRPAARSAAYPTVHLSW
jgi:hypothetical protein